VPATDLITISREFGAGGGELAGLLGARLGWRVLDADIPHEVAASLHIPQSALEEWDEHVPSLLEKMGNALLMGSPELLLNPDVIGRPDPQRIALATREVLLAAAARPPLIVVGHGAQSLFHERPHSLHLRLVAPLEDRIRRIDMRRAADPRDAATLARRMDADRANYVREHYGRDVRDPLLYHLQLNTGRIAMDDVVTIVLGLVSAAAPAIGEGSP
jgi:cytidylate kinase